MTRPRGMSRTREDGPLVTPVSPTAGETPVRRRTATPVGRLVVGGFYLSMGGVHLGISYADPQAYRPFADAALFAFVRNGWADVFMASPRFWGLCLFAGETVLGVLLLVGGRATKVGWCGVIAFHVLLMLFGFGTWLWCIPALAVLVTLARRDWPRLAAGPRSESRGER
ncbi:MAG: hypothetical protein ACXVXC_04675 [Nocardioidaceae bacterium]